MNFISTADRLGSHNHSLYLFLDCHGDITYSVTPTPQDSLTGTPNLGNTTTAGGATHAKWSFSWLIQELRRGRQGNLTVVSGVRQSILSVLKKSRLNILLIYIPLSWIFHFHAINNTLVLVFSFLAIVPFPKLLAVATDELSQDRGQTLAGLLEVTSRNAVGLIFAITALVKCELNVVQSFLIGSILRNSLLVPGVYFFIGGTRSLEQDFSMGVTRQKISLLTLSVIAVLLPATFRTTVQPTSKGLVPLQDSQQGQAILAMSRGASGFFVLLSQLMTIQLGCD
jgi:Ca2+/H+ antiporter